MVLAVSVRGNRAATNDLVVRVGQQLDAVLCGLQGNRLSARRQSHPIVASYPQPTRTKDLACCSLDSLPTACIRGDALDRRFFTSPFLRFSVHHEALVRRTTQALPV